MPNIFFFLLVAVVGIEFRPTLCQNTPIKVAVADYKPLRHHRDVEQAVIKRNINQYINLIETASNKDVNLIVFPEYGLTTDECLDSYYPDVYGIELENHLNKILCLNQKDVDDIIIKLSCAAITNHMHIVVNLIEDKNGTVFFSTVYFDDEGALKKIYRKQYITNKHQKYSPGDDDVAIIETKLGNFSLVSGLDLLLSKSWHNNNNIDKIILTSSVQSQYPFLYGPSLFTGYSKTTNKTLIVSSLNLKDYDGSGIYDSKVRYFYEEDLIIADIPLNNIYNQREQKRSKRNTLEISYDFENYDHCLHDLDTPTSHCNISVTFQDNIERLSYKKATCLNNNKLRDMTNTSLCALVYCPDKICKTRFSETINIKEIKISMTYTPAVQSIPISLTSDYSTIENFEYRKEEKHYYLSSKNEENKVISFGILLTAIEQDNIPINNNNITENVDRKEDVSNAKNEGNAFISSFNTVGILLFIICLGYICYG